MVKVIIYYSNKTEVVKTFDTYYDMYEYIHDEGDHVTDWVLL